MNNNAVYTNTVEMAPSTILLKIANDVAQQLNINVSSKYLLGAIAPDAVFARVNHTNEDINNAHFRQKSIKESWYKAESEFSSTDSSFMQGYCIHIMADVLWLSGVYAKLRKEHEDDFSKSALVNDMNYLEKWLYRQKEYLALWNAVTGTKITNVHFYVSPGEVELFKSQKSQSIKYDNVSDGMKYLTLEDADKFVNKAVKKIVTEITAD